MLFSHLIFTIHTYEANKLSCKKIKVEMDLVLRHILEILASITSLKDDMRGRWTLFSYQVIQLYLHYFLAFS